MIPAAAVRRTHPGLVLAAGRRSLVAHLVDGPGQPFTATGRLRATAAASCGQRARLADTAGRVDQLRICARCVRLLPGPVDPTRRELADVDAAARAAAGRPSLPAQLRDVLDFEREHPWWQHAGARLQAVRERFGSDAVGVGCIRYFQRLNVALEHPAALGYDAQTVRRLIRLREERKRPGNRDAPRVPAMAP